MTTRLNLMLMLYVIRSIVLLFFGLVLPVIAQPNIIFQYFHDDFGQITEVVDSASTTIEYVDDTVGNILQITRSTVAPTVLAIFNLAPQRGAVRQTVTIQGQAFDPTPANSTVHLIRRLSETCLV